MKIKKKGVINARQWLSSRWSTTTTHKQKSQYYWMCGEYFTPLCMCVLLPWFVKYSCQLEMLFSNNNRNYLMNAMHISYILPFCSLSFWTSHESNERVRNEWQAKKKKFHLPSLYYHYQSCGLRAELMHAHLLECGNKLSAFSNGSANKMGRKKCVNSGWICR